jgi:S-adenosylmethionine hydrolase
VPAELELALADWRLEAAGREVPIVRTYADVAAGAALALVDSYGHLELAVRGGHAADALGLGSGAAVTLRRRT